MIIEVDRRQNVMRMDGEPFEAQIAVEQKLGEPDEILVNGAHAADCLLVVDGVPVACTHTDFLIDQKAEPVRFLPTRRPSLRRDYA